MVVAVAQVAAVVLASVLAVAQAAVVAMVSVLVMSPVVEVSVVPLVAAAEASTPWWRWSWRWLPRSWRRWWRWRQRSSSSSTSYWRCPDGTFSTPFKTILYEARPQVVPTTRR